MKIKIETIFFMIFLIVVVYLSLTLVSSHSDMYEHYVVSREIFEDPQKLITGRDLIVNIKIKGYKNEPYSYPPLGTIFYGIFIYAGTTPIIVDIVCVIAMLVLMWKIDKRGIPFLMLSFMFVRLFVFGANDNILLVFTLACYYFFEKKPIISGIFAGLCPLVKTNGFVVLLCYGLSILIFKRKEIKFDRGIFKNRYLLSIIIAILVLSPWYIRNLLIYNGDLISSVIGRSLSALKGGELELTTVGLHPERGFIDSSGFFILPIDILLVVGSLFTIFNLFKTRKIELSTVFTLSFIFIFVISTILNINTFMSWRLYAVIFPFLAIEIAKAIPEESLKYTYVICFVFFVSWAFIIPQYAFKKDVTGYTSNICIMIKSMIGDESVSIKFYHDWYFIYHCKGLNITVPEEAEWNADLNTGVVNRTKG